MDNIYWDLEGLMSVKDLPSWRKFYESVNHYTEADFDTFMQLIYKSLLESFKKSDRGQRCVALNLPVDEFTTSEEIYRETGIYKVLIKRNYDLDDEITFYCSSDVLFYFYYGLYNKFNSRYYADIPSFFYDIVITDFGVKNSSDITDLHKKCFNDFIKNRYVTLAISSYSFKDYFGIKEEDFEWLNGL